MLRCQLFIKCFRILIKKKFCQTAFDEGEKRGSNVLCAWWKRAQEKKLKLVFNAIASCHASEGAMMFVVYTGNDKIIIFSAEMQNDIDWRRWFDFGLYLVKDQMQMNRIPFMGIAYTDTHWFLLINIVWW